MAVKGGPDPHCQVFDSTIRSIKWIFPYFTNKSKDTVSTKKIMVEEGVLTCFKEVLGGHAFPYILQVIWQSEPD